MDVSHAQLKQENLLPPSQIQISIVYLVFAQVQLAHTFKSLTEMSGIYANYSAKQYETGSRHHYKNQEKTPPQQQMEPDPRPYPYPQKTL